MKHLSIYEPLSKEGGRPKEDFFAVSEKYPIYVVADGVTLIQYLIEGKEYPNPSPAGEIARIFCEEAVKSAEERFENFSEIDIKEVFRIANEKAGEFNRQKGRTKESVDYWDNDFYAATAALVVIKDGKIYWGSICDSYVMCFDKNGELKFKSPDCGSKKQVEGEIFTGDENNPQEVVKFRWRKRRNTINKEGKLAGYGVITGESEALSYISCGNFLLKDHGLIAVLTDGFESYMKLPKFVSLLKGWPDNLELQIKKFTAEKTLENPKEFDHERTLIIIRNNYATI